MPCLHLAHSFRSLRVWLFSWNSHYHPIKLLCNDAAVNRMMSPNLSGKMSLTETIFGTGEIPDLHCSHEGGDSDVLSSLLGSIHLHIHGQLAALGSYYSYSRLDEMSDDHPKQFHPLSTHQYRCKCHSNQSDGCRDISVTWPCHWWDSNVQFNDGGEDGCLCVKRMNSLIYTEGP